MSNIPLRPPRSTIPMLPRETMKTPKLDLLGGLLTRRTRKIPRHSPLTAEQIQDLRQSGGIKLEHLAGPLPGMTERELAPDTEPNLILEQTNRLGFFSPPSPAELPSEAARHSRTYSMDSMNLEEDAQMEDIRRPTSPAVSNALEESDGKRGSWYFDPFSKPPSNKFKSNFTLNHNPMFKYTFFEKNI